MKKSELMLLDAEWWILPLITIGETLEHEDSVKADEIRFEAIGEDYQKDFANLSQVEESWLSLFLWAMFESEGE